MTNYSGFLNVSGSGFDSQGDTASFSASLGINLSATFGADGTGSAYESVKGTVTMTTNYAGGGSYTYSEPLRFTTPTFPLQLGVFTENEQLPVALLGATFGVSLNGTVSIDRTSISENVTITASGTYQGISVYASASGSGTLTAQLSPPTIAGTMSDQVTNGASTISPFRNVTIYDDNPGNQTETVTVTLSEPANGTLSDADGGSYDASTGVYQVTGTTAQVNAAVDNLVFNPAAITGAAGQTVTTSFSIRVTDTAGQSTSNSNTSVIAPVSGPTLTTVANFSDTTANWPLSGLVADSAGNLFGTTLFGGAHGYGAVYEIARTTSGYGSTPIVLVSFDGVMASEPKANLILDGSGNLFGTTSAGGASGDGTVFEVVRTAGGYATTPTMLVNFNGTNGATPRAALVADSDGNLFGTTAAGGAHNDGTVFEITRANGVYATTPTVLFSFDGTNGSTPLGSLLIDSSGNLFGTASAGGANNHGTIFELAKTGAGYAAAPTVLTSFTGVGTAGADPEAGLIMDSAGNLLGTTKGGGEARNSSYIQDGGGTVFELAKTAGGYASTPTTLISLNDTDGLMVSSPLLADAAGNLFATAQVGGSGKGTVFEVANTASGYATTLTELAIFGSSTGEDPSGNLLANASGDLLGTTIGGGANSDGTVYRLSGTGYQLYAPLGFSGAVADQAIKDDATVSPFQSMALSDPNAAPLETLTVTLSAAANGTLSNLDGGTFTGSTGTYTVSGSTAAVSTALQGLVFTPTAHQAAPDQTVTTTFTVAATDSLGATGSDGATSVVVTPVAVPPMMVNNPGGTSYLYVYFPTHTARVTVTEYSGTNNTGSVISNIVDNIDGTSYLFAYNPTGAVTQTTSEYAGANATGAQISDVVDNTDGSSLVYAYNPSDTVTLTATRFAGTDPSNGAPAGAKVSAVVDDTDGSSLVYAYNLSSTVTLTVTRFAGTDPATGAPTGTKVSAVVDNSDGTAIVYAYNPTSNVTQTASYYSGSDPSTGAPTGTLTSETFDYTNGESAITTHHADGSSSTIDYSGPDGTGSVISALSATAAAGSAASGGSVFTLELAPPAPDTIVFTGSGQVLDPGSGEHTIQFATGQTDDTLVLHLDGSDQVQGFDPAAGDKLDFSAVLREAQLSLGGDVTQLSRYVSVVDDGGAAAILFDPSAQGGGSQIALLANDGALVPQLQTLQAFKV